VFVVCALLADSAACTGVDTFDLADFLAGKAGRDCVRGSVYLDPRVVALSGATVPIVLFCFNSGSVPQRVLVAPGLWSILPAR